MDSSGVQRRWPRGAGAVALGFVACAVFSLGTDAALRAYNVFPPFGRPMSDGLFGLALSYRLAYDTGSSFLTMSLAPEPRARYAWIGGGIGFVLSLLGAAASRCKGPEFGPLWYPLTLAASVPLTTWLGVRLYARGANGPDGAGGKR